jgi:hypothetical protein
VSNLSLLINVGKRRTLASRRSSLVSLRDPATETLGAELIFYVYLPSPAHIHFKMELPSGFWRIQHGRDFCTNQYEIVPFVKRQSSMP